MIPCVTVIVKVVRQLVGVGHLQRVGLWSLPPGDTIPVS